MRKVYINSYYIDQEKYNKELNEKRELEKEMYQILKLELEQGIITKEEYVSKIDNMYSYHDETKTKLIPDSNINLISNIIAGHKKNQLFVPYDENIEVYASKDPIYVSASEVALIEEKIRYYMATNDDSLLREYKEPIQGIIFEFIDVCYDPCELEQFLKEYGVSILRKKKTR